MEKKCKKKIIILQHMLPNIKIVQPFSSIQYTEPQMANEKVITILYHNLHSVSKPIFLPKLKHGSIADSTNGTYKLIIEPRQVFKVSNHKFQNT